MTFAASVFLALVVSATAVDISPVTRVVELLQGLAKQVEKEGKVEEGLYEDFVCWGKSVVSKGESQNAADESRIGELETYVADLNSGRIELTSERSDLEKQISDLMNEMETAAAIRDKEHDDFVEAEDEMKMALAALASAIELLDKATPKAPAKREQEAVLLAVRDTLQDAAENGGMAKLEEHQAKLKRAVDMGERFLDKADSIFLR